ncbi:dihydropteroate synthase [Liquorilactobacillus satsumensis]|uniref:dihydropteroate synthase n=1 Tax=Liquorilactobacillus satsumensis TaxID=259059 RepID=UPI0039E77C2B
MIIQAASCKCKSRFFDQLTVEFSGSQAEITKLLGLLKQQNVCFSRAGKKVTAELATASLKRLLACWKTVFGTPSEDLEKILQDSRVFFKGRDFSFDVTTDPLIYSILNITPDSFYDGGVNADLKTVLQRVEQEISAGAAIFELGGKSSKPNFTEISAAEEWARIAPYIKELKKNFPGIILAVDSNTDSVVARALAAGVQIINDIDGFQSKKKLELVREYTPAVVTMFNGRDQAEQKPTFSTDLKDYFSNSIKKLQAQGLSAANIVIDPGVGFSNTKVLEFDLLKISSVNLLAELNTPIMIAVSRKSFISKLLAVEPAERLLPTLLFENEMLQQGGRILRVHDVKETQQMIKVYQLCRQTLGVK